MGCMTTRCHCESQWQISYQLGVLFADSEFENSLVFFVSPKKINKIIPEIKKNFNGRKIVFCREITKIYEEFIRKNVDELQLFEKDFAKAELGCEQLVGHIQELHIEAKN